MCITVGTLRAQLDGELDESQSQSVADHLTTCADCRQRADELSSRSKKTSALFSTLNFSSDRDTTDAGFALARFKSRVAAADQRKRSLFAQVFGRRFRPAWLALVVLIVVGVLSLSPSTAWAGRILSLFRLKQITVVSLDTNSLRYGDPKFEKRISQLLSHEMLVTKDPGTPQIAQTANDASAMAGFKVRLPEQLYDVPQLKVEGEYAFEMTVDGKRLQSILNEA